MHKQSEILITGASGLIGSALVRLLKAEGYENLLMPTHDELDLTEQEAVQVYFYHTRPEYVFHLAAKVGGIKDNRDKSADFIYENTLMHANVFRECNDSVVKNILFPGSACAYPVSSEKIKESKFLTGPVEPTNLAYAVAKQNGIVMAQSYAKQYGMKVVLPMVANTYGPGDRSSHVIPMMIKKCKKKDVVLWGTGAPLREFIHADDVASAFLFLMLNYDSQEIINVGTEEEVSISELAKTIRPDAAVTWDTSKPDGVMRKCLDSSKIRAMEWRPKIKLEDGLRACI